MTHRYLVHVAGSFNGETQACTRCGTLIADYRNTMSTDGSSSPGGWPVGHRIGVSVGTNPTMSFVIEDRDLDDDETLCGSGGHA